MHLRDLGLPDLIAVLVVAALLIWGGKLRIVFRRRPRPPSLRPSHPVPSNDSQILNRPHPAKHIWQTTQNPVAQPQFEFHPCRGNAMPCPRIVPVPTR
jgi:hypothetical protein